MEPQGSLQCSYLKNSPSRNVCHSSMHMTLACTHTGDKVWFAHLGQPCWSHDAWMRTSWMLQELEWNIILGWCWSALAPLQDLCKMVEVRWWQWPGWIQLWQKHEAAPRMETMNTSRCCHAGSFGHTGTKFHDELASGVEATSLDQWVVKLCYTQVLLEYM